MAHIIITTFLTRVSDSDSTLIEYDRERIMAITIPICAGIAVSLLTNWILFPVSASKTLR